MSLEELKCKSCGASLQPDENGRIVCPNCGEEYVADTAEETAEPQTADAETFSLADEKKKFADLWKEKDEGGALAVAKKIQESAPYSIYGWYYELVLLTDNFTVIKNDDKYFKNLVKKFYAAADEKTAYKYKKILGSLKKTEVKEDKETADKRWGKLDKIFHGAIAALCLVLALLVIIPSAIYSANSLSTFYSANKWDNEAFDSVVFELTLNENDKKEKVVVEEVWLNIGGINNTSDSETAAVNLTTATSETGSYTNSYGGGAKTVPNTKDAVGKWVRLATMTSTSTSRRFYQLSTKEELKFNEIVFLDKDGKKIPATVKYAGPNSATTGNPSSTLTSEIYAYRIKAAGKLVDEQGNFDTANVKDGVYDHAYTGLTEYETVTLESARNILQGGNFVDTTVNPFGLQLISLGVAIFGGNVIGLRIMPLLFTIGTLILLYFFGKELFGNYAYGLIFAALYAISGFALSGAALGSVNAIFVFFAVAAFYFMYKFMIKSVSRKVKFGYYLPLLLSGVFYSLAVSVKMQALYSLVALAGMFVLAMVRQYQRKGAVEVYARKRNLSITVFLTSYVLLGIVWTGLTYLFSLGVYLGAYSGASVGTFIGNVFSMPSRAVATSYSAGNASNVFAHLIGVQAEKLSAEKFFFGNTILSILALFSVLYVAVTVIYAYATKSEEVRTAEFKKEVIAPLILLGGAFVINLLLSLINANTAASESMLTAVFYTGFIVLAYKMLGNGKMMSVPQMVFAAIAALALLLFCFGIPKYIGIPVNSYPINFGSFRW